MNIGVYGGTFNPPHVGHLLAAEHAREQLDLARVIFVPSSIPPHKGDHGTLDVRHRLEMLRIALKGNRYFEISDVELKRGGVSYTVDTLRVLKLEYPDDALFFLLGMDMLTDFPSWRSPEEILELAEVVGLTRPDFPLPELAQPFRRRIMVCRIPEIAISSSDIRRKVREGRSIRYMVGPSVEAYIKEHGLYR